MSRTAYFAICSVLFVIVMTGWWFVARWLVYDIGWWAGVPALAVIFVIAWLIDRHEQRGRQSDQTRPASPAQEERER